MLDLLSGFVTELRRSGLPVSLTEHLDAAEAVKHIPLEDREALKYALAATLVKSSSHWRAFETAFEVYFAVRTGGRGGGQLQPPRRPAPAQCGDFGRRLVGPAVTGAGAGWRPGWTNGTAASGVADYRGHDAVS